MLAIAPVIAPDIVATADEMKSETAEVTVLTVAETVALIPSTKVETDETIQDADALITLVIQPLICPNMSVIPSVDEAK
jgi:hypothetical protein